MKKLFVICLAFVLVMGFTACESASQPSESESASIDSNNTAETEVKTMKESGFPWKESVNG